MKNFNIKDLLTCNRRFRLATLSIVSYIIYFSLEKPLKTQFSINPFSLPISLGIGLILQNYHSILFFLKTKKEAKEIEWKNFPFIRKLAIEMGLKNFQYKEKQSGLINTDRVAFCYKNGVIFGRKFFNLLTKEQRKAIAGHELAHMINEKKHTLYIFSSMLGPSILSVFIWILFFQMLAFSKLYILLFKLIFPLITFPTILFTIEYILHKREFECDKLSAKYTDPDALVTAYKNKKVFPEKDWNCTTTSHPPFSERVKRLEKLKKNKT